ncbi:AEC family transporter [Teichococcus cervicalis]|uniref:Transporter, auxin efflux carrier (AEC) family protein n=1 Tax=Pseudoroseomonas cervicalis ATCC 49957 TaxID=525371 RepID=D5RKJ7_9PROT|nr:AEC family transporter [Pseudoroseomonas cervicalis]EFH12181.1 transporter, auxin efflux carrier (AEC) family protein [Pseudoroseomonas cervicalis ATCC 49957]
MGPWLDAFVATFGMIALGAVLRRKLLPDVAIWAGMEKLVFTILLPALLVSSIGAVDLARLPLGSLAATIWGTLLIGTALSFALARALRHGHATTTSILQGGIRYNNLLAFAVAGAVHGAPGIAFGGIATGLIVPCVQVIITIAFALGGQTRPDPLRVLKQIATNPLILACAAGLLLALLGGPPPGLNGLLRGLAQGSLAVGLLCVGAALTPGAMRAQPLTQALTGGLKLFVMPAIAVLLARLLGLEPLAASIAILFMAQPTASTAYVQARAMGGDAPLMAAMITTQHVAAMLTLPIWVWLLAR